MSSAQFEVVYDGSDLRGHSMDVQHLAPALLALGNLIRDSNAKLNGERTKVNVLVQSDFEHKCFSINLEVIQSVYEQIKSLVKDADVESAKNILEWLGLIGTPIVGVIAYLRWRRGRPVSNLTQIKDETGTGNVVVQLRDGNHITVNNTVYSLAEDPNIQKSVAGIVAPLQTPGIDKIEFRHKAGSTAAPVVAYDKQEATEILASCDGDEEEIAHEPQPVTAHLRVHAPVFDPKADKWRFKYGDDVIYADITDTDIASEAIRRGGVMVDDIYKVRLQITEYETPKRQFRKAYKILEVLDFMPSPRQPTLFDKPPEPDDSGPAYGTW